MVLSVAHLVSYTTADKVDLVGTGLDPSRRTNQSFGWKCRRREFTVSDGKNPAVAKSTQVTVSNVAPTLSNLQLTGNSGTACLTGNEVGISYDVSDPGQDDFTRYHDWGDVNTDDAFKHTYAAGKYTIAVNGKDSDGASANELKSANNAVSLRYNMSNGLLSPVNADGKSVFKYGSTIPMKVTITDCENAPVNSLKPSIKFQKMNDTPVQSINESVSTSAANTNNLMRYSDGQYIYNLNTKDTYDVPDPQATYRAVISDNSSNPSIAPMNSQNFGIKK